MRRERAERRLPEPPLLSRVRFVDLQAHDLSTPQAQRLAARRQQKAARVIQERERRPLLLDLVALHQQGAAIERGLALPQAREGFALDRVLWGVRGAQRS